MNTITTYFQYMNALTTLIENNGNAMLTDFQMQQFIDKHNLYNRYKITVFEVYKDANEIVRKIEARRASAFSCSEFQTLVKRELLPKAKVGLSDFEIEEFLKLHNYKLKHGISIDDVRITIANMVNGRWCPIKNVPSYQYKTNLTYQTALKKKVSESAKKPLSETNIKLLIRRGGFDKTCGLDVETVRNDMFAVPNKYNMMVLLDDNDNIPLIEQLCVILRKEIQRRKNLPSDSKIQEVDEVVPRLITFNIDAAMTSAFSETLKHHQDVITCRQRLSGVLKDLFPKQKREVNILLQIYDLGIVDEMKKLHEIDELFVNRFTSRVVDEYGTNENLAQNMVVQWCLCYGKDMLLLKCNLF